MFRSFVLACLVASAAAFRQPRLAIQMKAQENLQKKIGSGLASAAVALSLVSGLPSIASAASGQGAKLSIFGENPLSSPYNPDANRYSPYSAFGDGSDAVYSASGEEEVKRKIGALKESAKRFPNYLGYIQKKTWLEVYSESQRQMYELRLNMNALADYKGTKEVKAAAKDFYVKFEKMALLSKQKNQEAALAAYDEAKAALDKYLSLL
mmetsp:Transcript_1100/g.4694  ORF Transcript_1100/g.4694 Transcript_1100/m.4694 type:complete len:209 (-) Transcript_1100:194-820(-)